MLWLLTIFKSPLARRVALAVVIVLAAALALHAYGRSKVEEGKRIGYVDGRKFGVQEGRNQLMAEYNAAATVANENTRSLNRVRDQRAEGVERDQELRDGARGVAVDRNRDELQRLRDELARTRAAGGGRAGEGDAGAAATARAAAVGELFESCAAELVDLAREADGVRDRLIGWQQLRPD